MLDALAAVLRHGARIPRSAPGLSAAVVATLALTLGTAAATFSVLNATLLQALPLREPERVVFLDHGYGGERGSFSTPTFLDFRRGATAFESLSACVPWDANLTGGGEPERVRGLRVSADFFDTLGVAAAQGRTFAAEEEQPGRHHVVLFSHGLWQRRFGGDPRAVGSSVRLDGETYEVIGIMPPGFRWGRGWGRETQGDVWAPFALTPERMAEDNRGNEFLDVYARLRPGIDLGRAQDDLAAVMRGLGGRFPKRYAAETRWRVIAIPLQEAIVGPLRPGLVLVFAAVASLLLVAATNVGGLLLARAAARRRDLSVRAALGASRARLAFETLAEAGVLAAVGGAGGLLLARAAVGALEGIDRAVLPRSAPFEVDGPVMAFALFTTLVAALASGLVPAWHGSRSDLMAWLRAGGPAAGAAHARRARRSLVVVQTALALALLVGAGLLVRSLAVLQRVTVGFRTADVVTARVQLPRTRYDLEARAPFVGGVLERIRAHGAIVAAGAISELPLSGVANSSSFEIEGRPEPPAGQEPHAETWGATPGYFAAMGVPLRRGRLFDERDGRQTPLVALVSEALVRKYFPGEEPLGRRIEFEGWRTIVGVVGDVRDRALDREAEPQIYAPYTQRATSGFFLVARTSQGPSTTVPVLRSAVQSADPELALFAVATMERLTSDDSRDRRVARAALSAFATAAMALAALGLYGVLAQSARERTREIGVRMALGAERRDILRLFLSDGGRLVSLGMGAGIALALAASRLLRGFVFGVSTTDPGTYATVALLLALVALLACALPAWRASRADPVEALRSE